MKKAFLFIIALAAIFSSFAQPVPKRVILEHFTNTFCPPCAARNPDLYTNLANHPSVYHMSYHPSAPYTACTLYQHNMVENDSRTNFYSVYGSTPRIVLQGTALPVNTQFSDTALFSPAFGQFTSFDLKLELSLLNSTTLRVNVTVYKKDTSSLTTADIYGVIAEDTLIFTSANTEPAHYDVFRKAIWSGNPIAAPSFPAVVGDSVMFMQDVTINNDWDLSKLYAMFILHSGTDVLQVAKSNHLQGLSVSELASQKQITIYPNPASDYILISGIQKGASISLSDINGKQLIKQIIPTAASSVDISSLSSGIYILSVSTERQTQYFKLIKP